MSTVGSQPEVGPSQKQRDALQRAAAVVLAASPLPKHDPGSEGEEFDHASESWRSGSLPLTRAWRFFDDLETPAVWKSCRGALAGKTTCYYDCKQGSQSEDENVVNTPQPHPTSLRLK